MSTYNLNLSEFYFMVMVVVLIVCVTIYKCVRIYVETKYGERDGTDD